MAPPLLVELLGESPGMAAVRETATRLLQRQSERGRLPPVLIQGETGVGKGLLARTLHRAGPRASGPFVDVNCAAIPETLLEAELFGYERGAFTDARHPKAGLFQTANHGTIFLDEVGLLPEALQAKLLKALEDRAVRRLGGTRLEPVDIWILTASNEDLAAAARGRRFREDLYHRLAVVTMTIPPLRERGEDILRLATHFLGRACAEYHLPPRSLTPDARAALLAYPWPGNVRELVNVMERVALLSEASTVTAEHLGLPVLPAADSVRSRTGPAAPEAPALADALGSVERTHLIEALRQTGGNVTRAAARLGISRDTLRYRMAKHGLGREETDRPAPTRSRTARADRPEAPRGEPSGETVAARGAAPAPPAVDAAAPLAVRWEGRRLAFLRSAVVLPDDLDPGFSPSRALEVLLEKIQTFGGRIEEMSPTGIVAAFGLEPVEDAPQRAALAAVAAQKAADRGKDSEGAGIQVRSGIAVRRVLVGASRGGTQIDLEGKREAWTVLDTLLGLAEPGAILVEEAAAAFLVRHFDLTPAGHAGAAGPVQRLAATDRVGAGLGRRAPTFVGRTRELGLLWSRLEDALRGHGQVVGLLGEAGIGKSRLLHEFRERLLAEPERRVTYLEGRCQSYASAIPYVPVMDVLRANFRIADNDSQEVIAEKVRAGIQEVGIEPAGAVPYIFRLFGIREGTETLDALMTSAVKARTFEVLRQLILQGARRRPILFVVEDLHWIDSTSEECFTTLMDSAAGVPAMCIVTYRPGYRAPWMDRSYVTQVALPPLSRDESLSVIRSAHRAEAVSDQIAEVILEKAEGNPFFLEELSRVVGDGGVDTVEGPRVPDTVQEVLLARIDRLSEEPRRLLQTAAVVGQEVPLSLLGVVWEGHLEPHLRELMHLEFLHVKTSGGESLYAFTHSLTREVAYESLPLTRRRALHGAIARALEASHVDRLAEVYDRLAYHYGRTDDAAKAVLYLERLAKKAIAGHALAEAVRILQEARVHVDRLPAAEQDRRRLDLALSEAYALIPLGGFQNVVTLLLRNQTALESLDDPRLAGPYHFLLGRSYSLLGDQRQASHHLGLGLVQAMRCEDDATRGRIYHGLAQDDAIAGRPRAGLEHGRQAVALLERAGEPWWIGPAYWTVGINYTILGQFDAALAALAQAAARGAEVGDPQVASSAAWVRGIIHVCRGDLDAAIRSCEDALARSPDPLTTALSLGWLGFAWLEQGDLASAAARLEEAIRLLEQFSFRQPQAWFSVFLAETHRRAHRLETALDLASKGSDLARATGSTLGIGWAERALGQIAQARGALGDAHDHFQEALQAFKTVESEFEVARTHLDLAALAHVRDDPATVATHLTEAVRHFRVLGVTRWVERAEECMRTWGVRS